MKAILYTFILICFAGIATAIELAYDYEMIGYGLHPAVCFAGICVIVAGIFTSLKIVKEL